MIGGEDLVLDGPTSPDDWTVIFYEIQERWPGAIFQKVGEDEYFAWKDQRSFRAGLAPDEVPHGFVHILMSCDCLTFVVDTEPSDAAKVGHELFAVMKELRGV